MRLFPFAMFVVLLTAGNGFPATENNLLGLYTEMAGDPATAQFPASIYTPFTVYLVVTDPYNDEFDDGSGVLIGRPVAQISGFECQVRWAAAGATVLQTHIPSVGTDSGTPPDMIVEYATPVPVAAGAAVLATWLVLVGDHDWHYVYMNITTAPRNPGAMAIVDAEDQGAGLVSVLPSSGDFNIPVFWIGGPLAAERASWGNVKVLFK